MSSEASNILRRFINLSAKLEPMQLQYLRVAARTLRRSDLRLLAREIMEAASRKPLSHRLIHVISEGDAPPPKPPKPALELRGLPRSIIHYGGPDAVRRDAEPVLVEALNRLVWR